MHVSIFEHCHRCLVSRACMRWLDSPYTNRFNTCYYDLLDWKEFWMEFKRFLNSAVVHTWSFRFIWLNNITGHARFNCSLNWHSLVHETISPNIQNHQTHYWFCPNKIISQNCYQFTLYRQTPFNACNTRNCNLHTKREWNGVQINHGETENRTTSADRQPQMNFVNETESFQTYCGYLWRFYIFNKLLCTQMAMHVESGRAIAFFNVVFS